MKILPTAFDGQPIRRIYDEATDTWWFSVVDVVQVLTQQADFQTARKYWNQLKRRLEKEGSESVTSCHQLAAFLVQPTLELVPVLACRQVVGLLRQHLHHVHHREPPGIGGLVMDTANGVPLKLRRQDFHRQGLSQCAADGKLGAGFGFVHGALFSVQPVPGLVR